MWWTWLQLNLEWIWQTKLSQEHHLLWSSRLNCILLIILVSSKNTLFVCHYYHNHQTQQVHGTHCYCFDYYCCCCCHYFVIDNYAYCCMVCSGQREKPPMSKWLQLSSCFDWLVITNNLQLKENCRSWVITDDNITKGFFACYMNRPICLFTSFFLKSAWVSFSCFVALIVNFSHLPAVHWYNKIYRKWFL